MIYWCKKCEIPIFENNICQLCGMKVESVSPSSICNPVFLQEKKLMSYILKKDINKSDVWYLGGGKYLIDGNKTKLPFVEFYKSKEHLKIAEFLRNEIVSDDIIKNQDNFIKANLRYINEKIYEAEKYVVDVIKKYCKEDFMPTVSFSGGKDSTVVSRVVRDALQKESIIHYFGDTTLEFPNTYDYVKNVFRKENPVPPVIPSETDNDFFKLCNVFGPPSKFERWCCTIFKTSNLNSEFQDLVGNSLTFLGIRRSESNERKNYERTQEHSKISTQVNAMPIIDWMDYDVWLYILYKELKFNDAYRYGYKRVGCWCCPNNSDWAMMITDIYFPNLAEKWRGVLFDFAKKTSKTDIDDYIENGKWKTRRGASGLETKNVKITDTPCNLSDRARNIIIKKKLKSDVLEFFKPFGRLEVFEKEDATYITIYEKIFENENVKNGRKICELIMTYGTTVIKVLPAKGTDPLLLVTRIKCQMRKYQFCISCTACDSTCPYGAIDTMHSKYEIDESKCKSCAKCIAKFYNGCIMCQVLAGKKQIIDDSDLEL